jgi:hypothetical protein
MKYNTNAIEIYQNMNIENIAPYMPANEIESAVFKINWCCMTTTNQFVQHLKL